MPQVRAPVFYDGQKHDAKYPQVIIDLSNIQNEPRSYNGIEETKLTISVDVYSKIDRLDILLDISNQVRNIMQQVRCAHWRSEFDDYSVRILVDESYQGESLKRAAFLFYFITYGIAIKKGND
ncbi:hypothetical protein [Limosilactobacillus reuteri]|uniref:hypothetical protein n=1 Tax=Limosilactobacillus reuteri TaxID=1598 RepID=UPI001CDBEBDC|nr:hypothetical protein [Limosilactobacillus reuteri]MCH5384940.1 hypothetical protein [Limosilactobacillus reuteri]